MKRFLIGQLACYGDCLYATTIAKQLKKDYPACHITWAVAEKYQSILQHNPFIDKIWILPLANGDYYNDGWKQFEKEAFEKKENGEFDEIIFSQILPRNWKHFTGTIRGSILSSYQKPIDAGFEPIVQLTEEEIDKVKDFSITNNLAAYKNVVLFECAPGSGQSKVNIKFALTVAENYIAKQKDTCFIISAQQLPSISNKAIINASMLSFRENAELTKYCTLLIGCSSGITWLATSNWAKKIPMVQLLNSKNKIYTGICYDHQLCNLKEEHVLERTSYSITLVEEIIHTITFNGIAVAKEKYHQDYKPSYANFSYAIKQVLKRESYIDAYRLIELHANLHKHYSINRLKVLFYIKYFSVSFKKTVKYPFKKKD